MVKGGQRRVVYAADFLDKKPRDGCVVWPTTTGRFDSGTFYQKN